MFTDSSIYYQTPRLTLYNGDALAVLRQQPDCSIATAITSPPYFNLCDYKVSGQIGLEDTIEQYLAALVVVFREVRRVLISGGVFWVVIGDTQNNYSPIRGKGERRSSNFNQRRSMQTGFLEKEQLFIPAKLVDAMRNDGWMVRRELIWDKGTSGAIANSDAAPLTHESIFMFGKWDKTGRPYLNCKPLRSSVLRYPIISNPVHPCPFPSGLVRELLDASMQSGETMLDPFAGSGTSLFVGAQKGSAIGVELNPDFCAEIKRNADLMSLAGISSTKQISLFSEARS